MENPIPIRHIYKTKLLFYRAVNRSHIFAALNQAWRVISGPIIMIIIPIFLSSEEQGYWFTFTSLSAMAVLADLGFSNIVMQFAAHEYAYLKMAKSGHISGEQAHKIELSSFFRFVIKWAMSASFIAFPIITIIGLTIIKRRTNEIEWMIPWVFYILVSGAIFIWNVTLSFLEGCNQIEKVQKIRFMAAFVTSLSILAALIFRLKLYALPVSAVLGTIVVMVSVIRRYKNSFLDLWLESKTNVYNWREKFFPLIWKYAISSICGYFMFQFYVPLVFYFKGPIDAGKIGITLTLWWAIFNISNVWFYVANPQLNMFVSKKEWRIMDKVFNKNLVYVLASYSFLALSVLLVWKIFYGKIGFLNRFVDFRVMLILSLIWPLESIINGTAMYLRAHKEEPFVVYSVISSVFIFIITYTCVKHFGVGYYFFGFLSSFIFRIPWAMILLGKKRQYHTSAV